MRHSTSRSWRGQKTSAIIQSSETCSCIFSSMRQEAHSIDLSPDHANRHTSIPKSSSIFMTWPKIAMYCMRLANAQLLLSCESKPGSSGACCSATEATSEWVRFRDPIAAGQPLRPVFSRVSMRGFPGTKMWRR